MIAPGSPIRVFNTTFQNPILLAAGTAGCGREVAGLMALDTLGGVITKSISPVPRAGHASPRVAEFAGGMLNSVGLANPGVTVIRDRELPWLAAHLERARVLVSVVGDTIDEYAVVIERLAGEAIVTAFELNLSCPNTERGGEHFGADDDVLAALVRRCRAVSTHPLIAKLAPTLPAIGRTARVAEDAGADGVSVVNTIPGMLYRTTGGRGPARPGALGGGAGGVSGPALLPVGVLATRRVRESTDLPVIGVGGVRSAGDLRQYLDAGASLVAVGTAALAQPRLPEALARAWPGG